MNLQVGYLEVLLSWIRKPPKPRMDSGCVSGILTITGSSGADLTVT